MAHRNDTSAVQSLWQWESHREATRGAAPTGGDSSGPRRQKRAKSSWNSLSSCFDQQCNDQDHLSEAERLQFFREQRDKSFPYSAFRRQMPIEENIELFLRDFDLWFLDTFDRHRQRKHDWLALIGAPGSKDEGFFEANQDFMQSHFGLDIWTSTVRLGDQVSEEDDPAESTVAFLTLPDTRERSEWWKRETSGCYRPDPRRKRVQYPHHERGTAIGAFPEKVHTRAAHPGPADLRPQQSAGPVFGRATSEEDRRRACEEEATVCR